MTPFSPIRNILTHGQFRREMKALTDIMTVPVTVIGDRVVVRYDERAFTDATAQLQI